MSDTKEKIIRNYTIEDLEELLDKLPYQIWLKNDQKRYIYINKLGAEKLGLSKEQIIGKSDYEFREYDIAEKCNETDTEVLEKKVDIYNEEHSKIDDYEIWHKVYKFILNRESKREIIGGVAREISLDKNLQLEFESNLMSYSNIDEEKKYNNKKVVHSLLKEIKNIVEYKNISIYLYDKDNEKFKFYLSENEKENKLTSDIHINKDIENKLCSKEIIKNKYEEIYNKLEKFKGEKENLEIRHIELANKLFALVVITYDESENYFSKKDSYLNEILSKIGYIVKQIENNSEIKCISEKKKELEDVIKLESMKVEFLSNMSHEFRTPINIILAITQLLNMHNKSLSDEKYKEYLNVLKQNSYRLLRLINNIMDITKVNSDSDQLNLVNCNIVSVLEEIVMSTVLYASEKKRNIIFDTDNEEIILACDEDKIERIMLNLISNAIKFSDCDTDIEVKINTNLDLNRVYISIKNYGSNIEFKDREKIFERFYRVDNSLNRKNEGCGIGLFLCRKFIEMHGGEIFLDNIDNGTQFSFYLPINITEEKINNPIIQKDSLIERCNIEFSDIYS
ncbi:sensor histidine kinase [Clostridium sp.]|uniref:sensor histidine kinase n=3 Tax=Clostridium sp. TaxID=1506 RepID=UPI0026726B14|nr:ATP-binding protein [Clostridium sp.]MCI7031249.1 ATP-binding protein [Clostridium sp.]